ACILWVLLVPATCAFTADGTVFVSWLERMTQTGGSSWLLALFVVFEVVLIPIALAWISRLIWRNGDLGKYFCTIVGVALGFWATTLFMTLPYIGVYANIPSALVGSLLSGGSNRGPGY